MNPYRILHHAGWALFLATVLGILAFEPAHPGLHPLFMVILIASLAAVAVGRWKTVAQTLAQRAEAAAAAE